MTRDRTGRDRGSRRPESRTPNPESREEYLPVGARVRVRFEGVGHDGFSYGRAGHHLVSVPYAVPGEEAVVEILEAGRTRAAGRLVSITRAGETTGEIRCRHFGKCGGCQWQHLDLASQRAEKTRRVRAALAPLGVEVRDATGGRAWGFRNHVEYVTGTRGARRVIGLYTLGGDRVVDIAECPVSHAATIAALEAIRDAPASSGVVVRPLSASALPDLAGATVRVGHGTGEAMVILRLARPLQDRTRAVHALLGRVPGMTSLYAAIGRGARPRYDLLWGRPTITERVGDLRVVLGAATPFPPNTDALPLLLDAVMGLVEPRRDQEIACVECGSGLLALHLAGSARFAAGLVGDADPDIAWESARLSGVDNVAFYARSAARTLPKLAGRGHRFAAATVEVRGEAPGAPLLDALAAIPRLVVLGRSLPVLARLAQRLERRGYRGVAACPVDLLPHTAHVDVAVRFDKTS